MHFRKRLFILIPTLLLIPLLLGAVPLKLANKMAHGGTCPQAQGKPSSGTLHCSAHSLLSHNHFEADTAITAAPIGDLSYSREALCRAPQSLHFSIQRIFIPLRC